MIYFELFAEYADNEWTDLEEEEYDNGIPEIDTEYHKVIDLKEAAITTEAYKNLPVALTNDHVVRLSVMTEPYFWHYHPNSEEIFIVLEGTLIIELDDQSIELSPNQLFTINRNTAHKTRPKNGRSVNLTISSVHTKTVEIAKD